VASVKALNHLYQAMCAVLYWCTATAIKTASKVNAFFIVALFAVAQVAAGAIQRE
jgi:hypothetical protein